MKTVNESELTDFIKNKAVTNLRIVQNESCKYRIILNLTWKEGDWNLITVRGKPREWASLDRLARHIREKYGGILPPINLSLIK